MKTLRMLALVLSAFWAAPLAAQDFQMPVTPDFYEGEIRFTGSIGPVYYYRWHVVARGDHAAVCGVGYLRDSRLRQSINDMARGATFYFGDSPFPLDATFFARARTRDSMAGETANCRVTQAPLRLNPRTVGLQYGNGVFRN